MTTTPTPRKRWARCATTVTGLLVLPALAAGCASADSPDASSDNGADGGDTAAGSTVAPVIDHACPDGLSADGLQQSVDYDPADVDGDGAPDTISIGTVPDGGNGCSAALVVTTAAGTAAVALPGLQLVPSQSFVPGGAATIGDESVIAAPVSFSPRGGGTVGLFTLVDGELTPVRDGSGRPWTILATVDDGGGSAQSIDCAANGLTHAEVVSDAMSGTFEQHVVEYSLDGTEISPTGDSRATLTPREANSAGGPGGSGLSIFASC